MPKLKKKPTVKIAPFRLSRCLTCKSSFVVAGKPLFAGHCSRDCLVSGGAAKGNK